MSELTTTTSADDLLPEIVKEHRAASEHMRHAVASAIKVGELLIQAKTLVRRGEWQDWLANNCPFAETTAQGYMRLARLPEENRKALRDSSLRAALDAIADHHERAIADESKTIEGEAEEVEPSDTDEAEILAPEDAGDERAPDDAGVEDAVIIEDEAGRTPEQKARDIAANAIHSAIQECHWKNVDRMLALQTLIKLLTEELKQAVVPLSAEESADARKALYEEMKTPEETERLEEKKRRGRPPGAKNKPKEGTDVALKPATGNEVDTDASTEARKAENAAKFEEAPPPIGTPGDDSIPPFMRRGPPSEAAA
jgi:hypothetical protein